MKRAYQFTTIIIALGLLVSGCRARVEIVVEIGALTGKGYPVPVDLDAGSSVKMD